MSKTNDLQIQKDEAIGEILDIMNKHKIYMHELELAYTDGVIKNYPWDKDEYRVVPSKSALQQKPKADVCEHTWSDPSKDAPPVFCFKCGISKVIHATTEPKADVELVEENA